MKYTKAQIQRAIAYWQKRLDEEYGQSQFEIINVYDKADIEKYLPEVIKLISISYANVEGGFLGQTDMSKLKLSTSLLQLVFKADGSILAGALCRRFQGSHKVSAMFCDQSQEGKQAFQSIIKENIKEFKNWVWCEVSEAPEHYYKKFGGYPIPNCFAEEILKKTGLILNADGFHYSRKIGNSLDLKQKVIFGFTSEELYKKVTQQADYAMKRDLFNNTKKILQESEYPDDLQQASTFIIQLSDLYDENQLSELTPSLSSVFDNAISTMEKYKNEYSWVSDELEYAKALRVSIPLMEYGKIG